LNNEETAGSEVERAKHRLLQAFDYIYEFGGFGRLEVDIKILKRGQREVLIRCGREYRFVLEAPRGRRIGIPDRNPTNDSGKEAQ